MIGPHTVEALAPGGRDEWGDTTTTATPVPVSGCFWQPETSSEDTTGQDTVTITARCFMPAAGAPLGFDETWDLRFSGVTYAVNGRPALHHTPAGPHHLEIQLREVRG